ncbi:MAG: hypothetical protein QXI33_01515 [Candidatus Pacearchaeota archaeon]
MTQPLWIQIKKKTKVPTNNVMARHQERSDWPTLYTIEYEQSKEIFEVLGYGGPIRTTSEFVYLIHKDFGDGEYLCIARTKTGARFWKFLKFICDDFRKYIILPTNVTHKVRKGRVISNKECKHLIKKINDSTCQEERRLYEQELLFEEEQLKKQIERRTGPSPYLINTPREGKLCEMEDYKDREPNEQIPINEDESSVDNEMFNKWEKSYFDGEEENDLDREERLKEQNKEEEKQMGFWGYEEPQQETNEDDIKDGMSIW